MTKEITQDYLFTLVRYESETGYLYWLKQPPWLKKQIDLTKPAGSLRKTFSGAKAWEIYIRHEEIDKSNKVTAYGKLQVKTGKLYTRARLVWLYHYGEFPTYKLYYVNGNILDSRIDNLRERTPSLDIKKKETNYEYICRRHAELCKKYNMFEWRKVQWIK